MTILAELAALYDRRDDLPRPGFSTEKIGGEVVLAPDGRVVEMIPLGAPDEKGKMRPRTMQVPAPPGDRRGLKIVPGFFWDPAPYALGLSIADDEISISGDRANLKFDAFREAHLELLKDSTSTSFEAFRNFLKTWKPADNTREAFDIELLRQNLVFRIEGQRTWLHDLAEIRALLERDEEDGAICLVTGETAPTARLHPSIKGVMGAQSSGASLVSFNELAYESHGKKQGDNAPVSRDAAFAYGTALNALLARDSGHSLRVGDTTVVFWVKAADRASEAKGNGLFASALDPPPAEDEKTAYGKLRDDLVAVAEGRWTDVPDYDPDARVFVLGLAPNAARLAVRFWHPGRMQDFAARLARFWDELRMAPSPWIGKDGIERPPSVWRLLYDVAALGKAENIPPLLGGALMRSVLTGADHPRTLLSGVIGRLRVEGSPRDRHSDGRRAAIIRAVLTRNETEEVPMALDETSDDTAYVLGRLFGAFTYAERSYADRGATIRDKYMGGASATPARIFPVLMKGYEHNRAALAKAGGNKVGAGVKADKAVSAILAKLPGGGELPSSLPLEDQGRFFVGFYHQLSAFYAKAEDAADGNAETEEETVA